MRLCSQPWPGSGCWGEAVDASLAQLVEESYALELAGDVAAAMERAQQALEMAVASDDPSAKALALTVVAFIYFRQGRYATARLLALEALAQAGPETAAAADALLVLGMCASETDNLVDAEECYRRAIDLGRQLGYHRVVIRGLHNLSAGVYMPRGQFALSLASDEEALRLALAKGLTEYIPIPLIVIAWVHWLTGQRAQAHAALEELGRRAAPDSLPEGWYFCIRANLAQEEGALDEVPRLYGRARTVAEAVGEPGLQILVRLGLSRYHRAGGDAAAACAWADDGVAIARRVNYRHLYGAALVERAHAAWLCGNLAAAEADLKEAIEVLGLLEAALDLTRAWLLLAALLHAQGHPEAPAAWREAARWMVVRGYAFLAEQERPLAFPLIAAHLKSADPETRALSAALLTHLERVPPPPLRVLTLGRFEVWQGTRRVDDHAWATRRAGELFRLLLFSPGRALLREQVSEALWPEKDPLATLPLFHQATSALRQALEPDLPHKFPSRYLEVRERKVALRLPPGSWVDLEEFAQHVEAGEWEEALSLYQGEPLPEDRYADWAVLPREQGLRLYMEALLGAARQRLEAGRFREALEACHRALDLDSWQEQAVLMGMRACVALGDRAGALRLYVNLERTLREELGIRPQKELQEFYRSLL